MKNSKLLLLLVAVLSLSFVLGSCSAPSGTKDTTDTTGSKTESVSGTQECDTEQAQESETEEPVLEHEFYDYFKLMGFEERDPLKEVVNYKGSIPEYEGSVDVEYNLVVIKTQELDQFNVVTDTYTLYDIISGKKLIERNVSNLLYEQDNKAASLKLAIDYPLICENRTFYVEDSYGKYVKKTENKYYLVSAPDTLLHTTTEADYGKEECGNGLVKLTLGDKVFFIDRNMEIVRTVDAVIANGYSIDADQYNGEYQGYLYVWDDYNAQELRVFNRSGVCSGKYVIDHNGELNIHVLNNGNVLIQDIEKRVSPFGSYDYKIGGEYCNVTSYIMNHIDGSLTEIKLDFIVYRIGTAYEQLCEWSSFPFDLAVGRENQAMIARFAGGALSTTYEYVCINCDLEVEYTIKNDTVGVEMKYAYPLDDRRYVAPVSAGGVTQYCVFDLDGNLLSVLVDAEYYETYIGNYVVTQSAIYDHKMNLVYDFSADGFELADYTDGKKIYLTKYNEETEVNDHYIYNTQKGVAELWKVASENEYIYVSDLGAYFLINTETAVYEIRTLDSDEVLLSGMWPQYIQYTNDAIIYIALFEDEQGICIIK